MNQLLLTVGNIYVDHNIYGVNAGDVFTLESGKDYFAERGERVLGGSAINVAMQAQRLGIEVGFIGKTGDDPNAAEVKRLLDAEGILGDLIREGAGQTTSMAVNMIANDGEFVGLHYGDASRTLRAGDIDTEHELFRRAKAVYFGGTAKQPALFEECESLFCAISQQGLNVFYDPNRFPAEEVAADRALLAGQLRYVTGYFPNEDELLQAMDESDTDVALSRAIESGVGFVALKLGARGCRIKTSADDFWIDGKSVEVMTTVGAGDCFNATFIASYLADLSLRECAERATAAAALKVSQNIWPDLGAIELNS